MTSRPERAGEAGKREGAPMSLKLRGEATAALKVLLLAFSPPILNSRSLA